MAPLKKFLSNPLGWIKDNKLLFLLILVVVYLLLGKSGSLVGPIVSHKLASSNRYLGNTAQSEDFMPLAHSGTGRIAPIQEAAPAPDISKRMVVQESRLSLKVNNVTKSLSSIKDYVSTIGGYMVNSSLSKPQGAASAVITIRVPANRLDAALEYFRKTADKVISENLTGRDATDEYEDITERLRILERNKTRLNEIMEASGKIDEILMIQEKIFGLQSQIDSLVGRQNYLEQTTRMTKVTIYLATDELSLPYSPTQPWRPQVIFKQAVRSLVANLQGLGKLIIWSGVYAIIWLPALLLLVLYQRRRKAKTASDNNTS